MFVYFSHALTHALENNKALPPNTTSEKLENGVFTLKRNKCFLRTLRNQSPVILNFCLRKTPSAKDRDFCDENNGVINVPRTFLKTPSKIERF